jgi:pimeloyl-ACP methyl ester carboxylesterase
VNAPASARGPLRSRGHTAAALAVVLATIGLAPAGPRRTVLDTRALRRRWPAAGGPGTLSVLVGGDPAGVRVLLVHGTPGSADGWAALFADPPPGVELVALDRPGFGHSGPEGPVASLAAQAAAVAELLPRDGRRAVLLGHSLGGAVVARVAAEHAQRVAAVLLVAAALDPAHERVHPLQPLGAWPPLRALLPRAIRNANAELMALRGELLALAPMLGGVTAPVLIVHGSDDPLVPVANVAYAESRLRAATRRETRLLPGRDHFLPWNAPHELRSAIRWGVEQAAATAASQERER